MLIRTRWALATLIVNAGLLGCGDGSIGTDPGPMAGKTGSGGASSTFGGGTGLGGASSSGSVGSGGLTSGGSNAQVSGGASSGGISNSFGGAASGGTGNANGGAQSGGSSSGGIVGKGGAASGGTGTGGKTTSGGASSGGKVGSGGTSSGGTGTGGKTASSGGSGGAVNTGAGPSVTCNCLKSAGEFSGNNIKSTIVVESGETYDGKCQTFRADSGTLGPGDQTEGQLPIFRLNGGTLQNVILGNSAADGVHIYGNATLKSIHWLDVGEDAMTIKEAATATVDCGSSAQGADKTFQVNAASTLTFRNFTAKTAGKFMRQNGETTFQMTVSIDHCDISNMSESIYRTDSSTSIVNMTNTRYSNIGTALFIFGSTNVSGDTHAQVGTFTGNVSY